MIGPDVSMQTLATRLNPQAWPRSDGHRCAACCWRVLQRRAAGPARSASRDWRSANNRLARSVAPNRRPCRCRVSAARLLAAASALPAGPPISNRAHGIGQNQPSPGTSRSVSAAMAGLSVFRSYSFAACPEYKRFEHNGLRVSIGHSNFIRGDMPNNPTMSCSPSDIRSAAP